MQLSGLNINYNPTIIHVQQLLGERERAHHYVDCVDGISVYVCMYVCMYGGHSVLRSNSKLHDNFGKMETCIFMRGTCSRTTGNTTHQQYNTVDKVTQQASHQY